MGSQQQLRMIAAIDDDESEDAAKDTSLTPDAVTALHATTLTIVRCKM